MAMPIGAVAYQGWTQFQADDAHAGEAWPVNGPALVDTPFDSREIADCEALASPVGWADKVGGGVHNEFVAVALRNCGNTNAVQISYGPSGWEDVQGAAGTGTTVLGYRLADSLSATPAVFAEPDDLDANTGHGLSTTRVVTLSESGELRIHSLGWTNGAVTASQEFGDDVFDPDNVGAQPEIPMLSPVIYEPKAWGYVQDNPPNPPTPIVDGSDAGAHPDDYAYVVAQRWINNLPPSGCNLAGGPGYIVQIEAFDMHESGQANVPRYISTHQNLYCRKPMEATPTVVYTQDSNVCFPGASLPADVRSFRWHLPPGATQPQPIVPPWFQNPPFWPAGFLWSPCPPTDADSFLVIATTDLSGGTPRLDVFDINPLHFTCGTCFAIWKYSVNLAGASHTALVAAHSIWVKDNGQLKQTEAVIVSEENGDVEMFWDLIPGPPSKVRWSISANGQTRAPIRSSAAVAGGAILVPYSETNPTPPGNPGELAVSYVDPGNGNVQNSAPTRVEFPSYGLKVGAALISPSAVTTQAGEAQPRRFYVPVEDRRGQPSAPATGLFEIDVAQILASNPAAAVYFQFTPNPAPATSWATYASAAFVSEDVRSLNHLLLMPTILCSSCPNAHDNEAHLTSYHS